MSTAPFFLSHPCLCINQKSRFFRLYLTSNLSRSYETGQLVQSLPSRERILLTPNPSLACLLLKQFMCVHSFSRNFNFPLTCIFFTTNPPTSEEIAKVIYCGYGLPHGKHPPDPQGQRLGGTTMLTGSQDAVQPAQDPDKSIWFMVMGGHSRCTAGPQSVL